MQVRRAIHVRTGQRAAADALEAWLAQHQVETIAFGDVYAACVHLLQNYEQVPDLVLIGADWLGDDELNIVRYVRQTWSAAAIILYGSAPDTPRLDLLPLVLTCRGERALRSLLDSSPAELIRRVSEAVAPFDAPPALPSAPALPAARYAPQPPGPDRPRASSLSDQVSTIFDPTDEG